ncbi:MAG: hypothetical protein AABZ39_12515, partial [Spirochaetota bacterium]
NRLAAVAGLSYYRDARTVRLLAEKLADDFMIDDAILPIAQKYPDVYAPELISVYRSMSDAGKRRGLIGHIASLRTPVSSNFITSVVQDASDTNRAEALRELIKYYPAEIGTARALVNDASLGDTALSILLKNGTSNDIPSFLAAFSDRARSSAAKILACQAVMRWGDDALKARIIGAAITSPDNTLVGGALLCVKGYTNASLYPSLSRIVRIGETSGIRLLSAEVLSDYDTPETWPLLITSLKEEYSEVRTPLALDVFVSAITLGITSIFDKISASASRSEFNARKERINAALRRKTGENLSGYRAWREWAVLRGMTVDGANMLQMLWSADPELRGKALAAAIRFLGYADRDAFVRSLQKKPNDETEMRTALAAALEKRGVLTDEK